MKISHILQKFTDIVAEVEQEVNPTSVNQDTEIEKPDPTDPPDPKKPMLPPLQQKQELLKRAVGVDNVYDDEYADQTHQDSDLNHIRKNAGLQAMIHNDDEPLD